MLSVVFKNRKGFTLVEILVSIVLLTIVISLFITLIPQMFSMNKQTENNLQGVTVSKDVLAKIKTGYYDDEINNILSNTTENHFSISNYDSLSVIVTVKRSPEFNGKIQQLYLVEIEVKDLTKTLSKINGYFEKRATNGN